LTGNFARALSRPFENSGLKGRAKFPNFDPCTVCGKTLRVSRGVYLPAFWATPPYYSISCFLGHTPFYSYKEPVFQILCLLSHQPFWYPLLLDATVVTWHSNCSQQCNNWFFITVKRVVAQKAGNTVIRVCGPKSR
jgi:hypothetical protein